ncbi:MAG: dipeptidase PepV [Christensenellales bacterium]|jgi:succinyl-diaminopimelate desuccinylase
MMTPEAWLDSHKEDFIRACQRVLRINSVKAAPEPGKPFGPGVYDCLVEALKIADELGLDTKNVDGYAGRIQAGEGDEIVGILSHLDVVPEGEGWTYPPYSGAYVDGCLYSRGAGDNKGPSMAALFALAAVAQSGAKFTRRVHLIFGCDEESGWDDMAYYGAHERMPDMGFSPDASFPVTHAEKGIMHVDLVAEGADPTCPVRSIQSGTRANIVPDEAHALVALPMGEVRQAVETVAPLHEKLSFDLAERDGLVKVTAHGVGCHGAFPEGGVNALAYLMVALSRLPLGDGPMAKAIAFVASRIGLTLHGEDIGLGISDPVTGLLSCNLGVMRMDGDKLTATIDIRHPVDRTHEQLMDILQGQCAPAGMRAELGTWQAPLYLPKDHFIVTTLMDIYKKHTGDVDAQPQTMGGGTYARAIPNAVAFGPSFPGGKHGGAHEPNEFVSVDELIAGAKIFIDAILQLACA